MVHLSLRRDVERRKKLLAMFKFYMEICRAVSSFLILLSATSTLCTYRPRVRSYALDFVANREYVRRFVYDNDNDTMNEEIEGENVAAYNSDDEDFSNVQPQTSTPRSDTSSSRKRKRLNETGDPITSESIIAAARIMGENIKEAGIEFSKSVGAEVNVQQKAQELDGILSEVEGLTSMERVLASIKLPESSTLMFVFFSIDPDRRLEWLRTFLTDR